MSDGGRPNVRVTTCSTTRTKGNGSVKVKWKLLGVAGAILVALIGLLWFLFLSYFDIPSDKHEGLPQVLGLPAGYELHRPRAPYRGPHPSRLKRPDDPFSYPIRSGSVGPVEPLFAGPLQYPFLCQTAESGLGQPLVDNHEGAGVAVYAETDDGERTDRIVGYSKDCSLPTRVHYYYARKEKNCHDEK